MFRNLLDTLRSALESLRILRRPTQLVPPDSSSKDSIRRWLRDFDRDHMGTNMDAPDDTAGVLYSRAHPPDDAFQVVSGDHRLREPLDRGPRSSRIPPICGDVEWPVWIDPELGIGGHPWAIMEWVKKVTDGKVGRRELAQAGFIVSP